MSDLSDTAAAMTALEQSVMAVEETMVEHEQADNHRFLLARKDIKEAEERTSSKDRALNQRLDFLESYMNLLHDQLIEGFRKLGAPIEKRDPNEQTPRVGKHGPNGH